MAEAVGEAPRLPERRGGTSTERRWRPRGAGGKEGKERAGVPW